MNEENPCETTPKHGVSGQADRTAHPEKSPTISTPDAGKSDRTEGEPSEKVGNGLLPCPFCGGEASAAGYQKWSHPIPDMTWDGGYPITEAYFCNCMKCGISNIISGVGHRTEVEAIAAWNRRANGGSHD